MLRTYFEALVYVRTRGRSLYWSPTGHLIPIAYSVTTEYNVEYDDERENNI